MAYKNSIAVLADPTRRELFEQIVRQPRHVAELAGGSGISQPAVSQHLRTLKDAGLVSMRKDGKRHLYSARTEALGELRAYVEDLWDTALLGMVPESGTGGREDG